MWAKMYLPMIRKLRNGFLIIKHHTALVATRNLLFGYEDIIAEFVVKFSAADAPMKRTLNLMKTSGKLWGAALIAKKNIRILMQQLHKIRPFWWWTNKRENRESLTSIWTFSPQTMTESNRTQHSPMKIMIPLNLTSGPGWALSETKTGRL